MQSLLWNKAYNFFLGRYMWLRKNLLYKKLLDLLIKKEVLKEGQCNQWFYIHANQLYPISVHWFKQNYEDICEASFMGDHVFTRTVKSRNGLSRAEALVNLIFSVEKQTHKHTK